MKKTLCLVCILLILLTVVTVPSALAMGVDYTGEWVCLYVDMGDGVMQTEYNGQVLQDVMTVQLNEDGSFMLDSFGQQQTGTWQPTGAGIAVIADGIVVPFSYEDDMLVNTEDGVTMYFGRAADAVQGGFNTLLNIGKQDETPAFDFTGNWKCIAYEASGVSYDITMFFPDGIPLTLNADGTGAVQITPDYAESITWAAADGGITIDGSYMLYDPQWDAETGQLSFNYAADIVRVVFVKNDAGDTVSAPDASMLPQVYTCDYFTIAFPDNWVQDEFYTYNYDQYFSAQYSLNDENGWALSSVQITVSVTEVAEYRSGINELLEYAGEAGRDTLDAFTIGEVPFQGLTYGDYWIYTKYLARVPEASVTIAITISDPENAEDVLPDILNSISFSYPIPDPPHVDPPMPEDGVAYQPSPAAVSVDGYDLKAEWLTTGESVIPKDMYSASLAATGSMVYVLASQKLYLFDKNGSALTAQAGSPLDLGDSYTFLSAANNGMLYATDGFYQAVSYDGGATENFELDGYLSMHPDGQWGLSYWGSSTVKKVTFTADGMAMKDWVLKDLSDDAARQGRFSSVDTIMITDDHIFVAGSDATTAYAVRIVMYDFDGNVLAVFGSDDWMDDSAFGSVAGIVQTDNGIIALDGFYQNFKLFGMDGAFLGMVECDDLLGTNDPWPLTLTATDGGALVLLAQERLDQSAVELLVFEITGF